MCNYYAVYLANPRSAEAYISFLRKNALSKGVQYILYPKLSEFPKVFQDNLFGLKYDNFLCILYYGGDEAFFPKEFQWPGVILDHVYTQSTEAEDYVARKVLNFVRTGVNRPAPAASAAVAPRPVRRFREERVFRQPPGRTNLESYYYRMLDRFNDEEYQINRLLADHKERVRQWQREHVSELRKARADKERIEAVMRERLTPICVRRYNEWKKNNPGKTSVENNEVYASICETVKKEARYWPEFKFPLDRIEQLYASKPHKSPELKQRIAEHKQLGERLERLAPEAEREGDEWDEMIRDKVRRFFD